ncbi:MAG: TonB-dependent receptor [Candidatus Omnitrophica bacterium]|nr:TonB-dependent receptor [Candidatus Omnitrophota bacterium]
METNMRYFFRILIILLIILLSSVSIKIVWADDVNLERIVVTPSRIEESYGDTCRNVDVVTSKNIESFGSSNVAEVIANITSVNIRDYGGPGGLKTITMRGATASQVLVLIDGRPVNNPRNGQVDLSSIPLDNIERIEVVHGPGSSLYGSQAMGGMVNIITKRPPKKGQKTEATTSFGTFRTYTEKLLQGARIGKFGYLVTGGYKSSEGFRANSEFNSKDANVKLEYEVNSNNNLILNSGFYTSKAGTPGTITAPDIDDQQKDLQNYFDFNWDFKPDNLTRFAAKIYQNYDRLEFMENSAGSAKQVANSKSIHSTISRGFDLQFNSKLADVYQLVCGFNYVGNYNDSTSSAKHRYFVRAGYLENQWDALDNLKLNLGVRVDNYSNFGTEASPSFGFLYRLGQNNKIHGLVSRSFRAPTFNDLYWPNTTTAAGNPDLSPEKGITAEIGLETEINKYLSMNITYYRNNFDNLIDWVKTGEFSQPINIKSAAIDGIEFKNRVFLGSTGFELDLGYTYLRAKDKETGKYLTYQPMNKADASLKYKDINGFTFEFKGQFTDKRFDDANNTISVKRFFVFGLSLSKKFDKYLTCFASIDNLFARKYQVVRGYPMPGFSVTGGLKLEF